MPLPSLCESEYDDPHLGGGSRSHHKEHHLMSGRVHHKMLAGFAASAIVFALTAGSASAHFCYFTEANTNAELGRAGSNGFATFGELAFQFTGLCDAGIAVLADAAGVSTTTTINAHGVMAGGTLRNGKNIKPITHLDFAAIEAAFPAAEAACM